MWSIFILLYPLQGSNEFWGNFILNMHNIQFILGVLLAHIFFRYERFLIGVTQIRSVVLCVSVFLVSILCLFVSQYDVIFLLFENYFPLVTGLMFSLVVLSLLSVEKAGFLLRLFNFKVLLFLGSASYSIYLVHNPAISILNRLAGKVMEMNLGLSTNLVFIIISFLATLSGVVYFLLWEKPVLNVIKSSFTLSERAKNMPKLETL